MKVLWGLVFVVVMGCAAFNGSAVKPPTLLVDNRSMEPLRVYDPVLGLVSLTFPGETECVNLTRQSLRRLFFRQLSSEQYGPEFDPWGYPGWQVVIYNVLWRDVLSLQPVEACK